MKLLYYCIFVLAGLGLRPPTQPPPSQQQTMLWGIVTPKGDTSYLFGTFHEFGNSFIYKYPIIKRKQKAVDAIVLEATGSVAESVNLRKWTQHLTARERKATRAFLKQMKTAFRLRHIKRIPPIYVNYALLSDVYRQRCNIATPEDVVLMDELIANSAITFHKQLIGLESAADTIGVLKTMLDINCDDDTCGLGMFRNIVMNTQAYHPGIDSQCIEADKYRMLQLDYKFDKASTEDDTTNAILLDRRNDAWVPQILRITDTSSAFIAVGFGHLCYQKGLIMQLRRRGYTVFPIALNN